MSILAAATPKFLDAKSGAGCGLIKMASALLIHFGRDIRDCGYCQSCEASGDSDFCVLRLLSRFGIESQLRAASVALS